MQVKKTLQGVLNVVLAEAKQNPEFAHRLEEALGAKQNRREPRGAKRPAHRRASPVLDPIEVSREGELTLRSRLRELTVEQLKDIVADHGMDPGKLAMKWKDPDRLIDRIVEYSLARAKKGDVFLA
jgi:hypothetical protein